MKKENEIIFKVLCPTPAYSKSRAHTKNENNKTRFNIEKGYNF